MSNDSKEFGEYDGEVCGREGCEGIIQLGDTDGCSCHINPPCPVCVDAKNYCPLCGWEAE